jgi:hypothetical protein
MEDKRKKQIKEIEERKRCRRNRARVAEMKER